MIEQAGSYPRECLVAVDQFGGAVEDCTGTALDLAGPLLRGVGVGLAVEASDQIASKLGPLVLGEAEGLLSEIWQRRQGLESTSEHSLASSRRRGDVALKNARTNRHERSQPRMKTVGTSSDSWKFVDSEESPAIPM